MPAKSSPDVSVTPELTAFIATGRYRSAGEVVRAALRLPDGRETRRTRSDDKWGVHA